MVKREKRIIVGDEKISALGYFYIAIKDSHLFDILKIMATKYHWHYAEVIITYLRLNGWEENEVSRYEEKQVKSKCNPCNKVYEGQKAKCPECGRQCREYSFDVMVCVMEKLPFLTALQHDVLKKKETKDALLYIESEKNRQRMKDHLILRGWS